MDIRPGSNARPTGRTNTGALPLRRTASRSVAAPTPTVSAPQPPKLAAAPKLKTARPVAAAATPQYQQPIAPAPVKSRKRSTKSQRRWPSIVRGTIVTVVLAGLLGWFAWSEYKNAQTAIDTTKYQAVFLTNGQVYFGKLAPFNDKSMKLTDVFYLQTKTAQQDDPENPQKTTTEQADVQLIKLGDEIHGPRDEMVMLTEQVLFYENLKSDSKVAESIKRYKEINN